MISDPDERLGPTKERLRQAAADEIEVVSAGENEHWQAVRIHDSPLSKLAIAASKNPAKGITGEQFQAGLRFYADAYTAGMIPSKAIDMSRIRVDCEGYKDTPDHIIAAQTRYNNALKKLDGESYHILRWIVIHEVGLNQYAAIYTKFSQHRERRAVALHTLRKALDRLDEHYYPRAKKPRMVSVMADGARPVIPSEEMDS